MHSRNNPIEREGEALIGGTVVGQSGLADAQLGPSINMYTAEWIEQWYWLTDRRVAPTIWNYLEIEL